MFSKCNSASGIDGVELSFSSVLPKERVWCSGSGEGPLICIPGKLPGGADPAGSLTFSSKGRTGGIVAVGKFPGATVSTTHLEIVVTLKDCLWV